MDVARGNFLKNVFIKHKEVTDWEFSSIKDLMRGKRKSPLEIMLRTSWAEMTKKQFIEIKIASSLFFGFIFSFTKNNILKSPEKMNLYLVFGILASVLWYFGFWYLLAISSKNRRLGIKDLLSKDKISTVPPEVKGWNWGAFFLNWIWGVGNGIYATFLIFIILFCMQLSLVFMKPFLKSVIFSTVFISVYFLIFLTTSIILGVKGSAWAWQSREWKSVEHFKKVQRIWAAVGLVFAVPIIVGLVSIAVLIMHSFLK